jgi:hypothetical protein
MRCATRLALLCGFSVLAAFAVSAQTSTSDVASNVSSPILANETAARGSIGVQFQEDLATNPDTLKSLGASYGVVIEVIEPGSPAEKAGLKSGDVITAVNGQPVKTANDLVNPIAHAAIGSKVGLSYVRDGAQSDTTATVADRTRVFPDSCSMTVDRPRAILGTDMAAPYSAIQEYSRTRTLADGTVISPKPSTMKIYRDSQGRVRREFSFCQRQGEQQGGIWVQIEDPVSGYAYILDPGTHTAYRFAVKVQGRGTPPPKALTAAASTPASAHGTNATSESLGSQTMEGVPVDGVRTTRVVPAGEMDNDRPFDIVQETWTSPLLEVAVLAKTFDPRVGEYGWRLTNIDLSEPDPALFQPPADYTVSDSNGAVKVTYQRPSTGSQEK